MPSIAESTVSPEAVGRALAGRIAGDVLTDRFSLAAYSTAACIYKIRPVAVVVPRCAADVEAAVRAASELGAGVIARGAGSGLCGQVLGRGIVLDFTKYMAEIIEIDPAASLVRVQPGAVTGRVNEALAAHGLMLGPDPSSEPFCTIGGNLGNNSSGARGIRYGSIKDYVAWLDVVLADGSRVRLEPLPAGDPRLAAQADRDDLLGRITRGTQEVLAASGPLLDRYRPHISKNSAGYNVFEVLRDGLVDLTRLVVGSEGTLAVIVEAALRAVPKPRERASLMLWFDSLEKAGEAVHHVLSLGPSACEIMERHFLDIVRTDGAVPHEYLPAEADTVLLIEFLTDSREANEASVARARGLVIDELGLAFGGRDAFDPREQERLWLVRKRAVQILQRLPGPTRVTPFIEDVVVPPQRLVEYIRGLRDIFERFGVEAAVYGHAGDSNLHARPLLDLRRAEDVAKMKGMAAAVAHLTVDLGGTISCEHGDGLTRSGYLALQFGPLYERMADIKRLWDPAATLNPGKIITTSSEMHAEDLRMGPDYAPVAAGDAFDREPWATQLGRCHGCGTCRAYCPVYKITRDEVATPRAKANLLRSMLSGDLPLGDLADERMRAVADLCYNCKTCRAECPSHVDIPGLVLKHKARLAAGGALGAAERAMLNVRLMGRLASAAAPLANALLRFRPVRALMEAVGGVGRDAPLPRFTADRLLEGTRVASASPAERIAYFAGCFELFNESGIGRAALTVLGALDCEVLIPPQACCGVPKISAGDVDGALKDMRYNLDQLAPLAEAGWTVTSGCPSCVLTLAEDYPELARDDPRAAAVAARTADLHTVIERLADRRGGPIHAPRADAWKARALAYHAPCHLRAAGRGDQPRRLLEKLLGLEFAVSNATCCGMGGTYGIKAVHAEMSKAIAQETLERLRGSGAEIIVTSCGMCRTQLAAATGLKVLHPMEILADALRPTTQPMQNAE